MSTVEVTTNSTVMLSFLHWVIPQYIVLAPTSVHNASRVVLDKTVLSTPGGIPGCPCDVINDVTASPGLLIQVAGIISTCT